MAALGYKWAALELDDYDNAARWEAFRSACHSHSILAGPWFTNGMNLALTPMDADFTISEMESADDLRGAVDAIPSLPKIPRAIITNFVPFEDSAGNYLPQNAKPLIDAGFACLTEAYLNVSSNFSPERLDFTAREKLGFPSTQPVFGIYGGKPLSDYAPYMDSWPGWSVYLAEYF